MDEGVKKDIWSVMEDFAKAPGGKDLNRMKAFCRRDMDAGVKKDIWSLSDGGFCKSSGGQGLEKDEGTVSDVCGYCGLQAGDSVIHNLSWYTY
jgi:hypothetical protein